MAPAPDPTVVLQVRSRKLAQETSTAWEDLATVQDTQYVYTQVKNKREYQFRVRAQGNMLWVGPVTVTIEWSALLQEERDE